MEEEPGFGIKNSLTLPSLANKCFNSLRNENDEPIYTYNDDYMRQFLRQSIKGGKCSNRNQYYKSIVSDEVYNIIPKELNIHVNKCETSDKLSSIKINIQKKWKKKKSQNLNNL